MDDDLRDLVRELHGRLEATEELSIHYKANRWLGEAEAAAADAVGDDVPEAAVTKRVAQVSDLLERVGDTENPAADEHVEAARELAARIERRLSGG